MSINWRFSSTVTGMLLIGLLGGQPAISLAQPVPGIAGHWQFNSELSDNTDRQVEAALRAAGQQVRRRLFDSRQDRYRGGPPEQELYDRISYDRDLTITLGEPEFSFEYNDDFIRPVYTDNRRRSISLNNIDEVEDFSFAHWENGQLQVEGRPRDGGFTQETYTLIEQGARLRVELYLQPRTFTEPVEIVRVYDRITSTPSASP